MPLEGAHAMWVCAIAERFGQLPSAVLNEPVEILRLIEIDHLMRKARKGHSDGE